jgi:hypothetical protein
LPVWQKSTNQEKVMAAPSFNQAYRDLKHAEQALSQLGSLRSCPAAPFLWLPLRIKLWRRRRVYRQLFRQQLAAQRRRHTSPAVRILIAPAGINKTIVRIDK